MNEVIGKNMCKMCLGWGGKTVGNWSQMEPPEYIPCKHCVEQGLCPHCAGPIQEGDEGSICEDIACAWSEVDPQGLVPELKMVGEEE